MIKSIGNFLWEEKNALLVGGAILFVIITWMLSLSRPFTVTERTQVPVIVAQGSSINICRTIVYHRDTTVKLSRHIVRWDEELKMLRSRQVGSIQSTPREIGEVSLCRDVIIPKNLTLGEWTLWTYVEVTSFPWWNKTFKILPLNITVIEGGE